MAADMKLLPSQDILESLLRSCADLDLESWCIIDALGKPRLWTIQELFGATEADTERLLCGAQWINKQGQVWHVMAVNIRAFIKEHNLSHFRALHQRKTTMNRNLSYLVVGREKKYSMMKLARHQGQLRDSMAFPPFPLPVIKNASLSVRENKIRNLLKKYVF
jgi:hypothetical protein